MSDVNALLMVGGPYHDQPGARAALLEALAATEGIAIALSDDLNVLAMPLLANYDILILYTTGGELTEAAAAGLDAFVSSGKGLVGIHSAATSFTTTPHFKEMLGCRFVSHPPLTDVTVSIIDRSHPITRGLSGFTVQDELYVLDCDRSALRVLANAAVGPLIQPTAYIKSWGEGRIFYLGLGHDRRCFQSRHFQKLLGRGILWAAGRLD